MRAAFISLEGGEGAGKSTQMHNIREWLEERGHPVIETREPGGTHLSELIRDVVLHGEHPEMSPYTEMLLIFAARAQHVAELIMPALKDELGERQLQDPIHGGHGDELDVLQRFLGDVREVLAVELGHPAQAPRI